MDVEILAVGTELLLGDILNTNAQFLAKELAKLGMNVFYQSVVGDNRDRLLSAFKIAFSRADMIITTGGLGPTEDDLTKEVAAEYFKKELVLHEQSWQIITDYFSAQHLQMTENNKKQAYIPEGATIIPNEKGTAPGICIEENGKILIMMPGPPSEAIPMFETQVRPFLQSHSDGVFVSRTLRFTGIGESMLASSLQDMLVNQTNPSIAPYAKTYEVHLRVTASAKSESEARTVMEPVIGELYSRFGDTIYGEDETTLEQAIVSMLKDKGLTVACAESCTGGGLTSRLVNCPGASQVLLEGVISYSNESKMKRLGVKEETLSQYGAVSKEVAAEMAAGIAYSASANIGISVTGIAGPDGGTVEKPVGLVFIGLSVNGDISTKELHLRGDREKIRGRAVMTALDFMRQAVLKL